MNQVLLPINFAALLEMLGGEKQIVASLLYKFAEELTSDLAASEQAMGDRGRVLVRPSGTEPLLRVMVEADDPEAVQSWTRRLAELADTHLNAA